ncbi:hypothetical protein DFA_11964 [Cavenderia fasciculata]|uniref:Uncharacterized protein n=1 Tax=Cavenderia fasciculata TaxID=261658 RepID=F4QF41_CACFS|nr:uncharacterized protein DFA_11964 [Cavenderia fasciculata]EGG14195.1 hypothetical protein DFA_11964 [Cavenderia fasciculata]|eukprot:XP_004350903.1 hypothetical protein DFA_11964 [Cavenderia fasciculata]
MVGITVPQITRVICYDKQKIKITRKISINGTTKLEIPNTDFNQPFIVIDPLQTKPPLISGSDPSLMAPSVTTQAVAGFGGANQQNVYLNRPLVVTLHKDRSFEGVCIAKNTNNNQLTIETKDSIEIVNMNDVHSLSYLKGDNLSPTSTLITIFGNGSRDIEVTYFILKDPNLRVRHQIGFKTLKGAEEEQDRYSLHLITYIIWDCIEKIDYPIKLMFLIQDKMYKVDDFIGGYLEQTKNEIIRFETDVKKVMVYTDMKLDYQAFLLKNISNKCIPTGPIVVEGSNALGHTLALCEPNEHVIVYCPPVIGSSLVLKPDLYVKKTSSISPIRIPRLTYSKMVTSLSLEANVSVSFLFANLTNTDYSIVLRNSLTVLPHECHHTLVEGILDLTTNNATKLNPNNSLYLIELPQLESKTLTFKGVRTGTKSIRHQIDLSSFKFMERVFGAVNQENRDEFEISKVNVDNKEDQDVLYECFKHLYMPNSHQPFGGNNNFNNQNHGSLFGQQKTQTFVQTSSASNNEVVQQQQQQPQQQGFGLTPSFGPYIQPNVGYATYSSSPFGHASAAPAFGHATAAPSSGGLFGSSAPATTTSTFGGAPASASAFGSSQPTTSGGLFGSSAPATTSTFGGAPASASAFGSSQPTTGGGGLFGAPNPSAVVTGTVPATSQPTTSGLFGAPASPFGSTQPTTTPVPSTGFAFSTVPASTGAFGQPPTGATGAFGQPPPVCTFQSEPTIVASNIEQKNLSLEELRLHDVTQKP